MDKYKVMTACEAVKPLTDIMRNENHGIEDTDRLFIARQVHNISVANIAIMERLTEMINKPEA